MGQALAYLHAGGITHRDVKPGNVLLDENLSVAKLADFGTSLKAKVKDPNRKGPVGDLDVEAIGGKDGGLVGFTPSYVPPEVVAGQAWGVEVDVWALGCTVIQMVTT